VFDIAVHDRIVALIGAERQNLRGKIFAAV